MVRPKIETIGQTLYWSYANLAMMHAVLTDNAERPGKTHFMIRSRLYKRLCDGSWHVGKFFDDEKVRLNFPIVCWYCGSSERLSLDHIIPQSKQGSDGGENLIHCCRSCNSSKGATDLLVWMAKRDQFPCLYLLRRYLKLAIQFCTREGLLELPLTEADGLRDKLHVDLQRLPHKFPPASELKMFTVAIDVDADQPDR